MIKKAFILAFVFIGLAAYACPNHNSAVLSDQQQCIPNDDIDQDGIPGDEDTDDDGDGIEDEADEDDDGDGTVDDEDTDDDGDCVPDDEEGQGQE